jgi:hypothetical protein
VLLSYAAQNPLFPETHRRLVIRSRPVNCSQQLGRELGDQVRSRVLGQRTSPLAPMSSSHGLAGNSGLFGVGDEGSKRMSDFFFVPRCLTAA